VLLSCLLLRVASVAPHEKRRARASFGACFALLEPRRPRWLSFPFPSDHSYASTNLLLKRDGRCESHHQPSSRAQPLNPDARRAAAMHHLSRRSARTVSDPCRGEVVRPRPTSTARRATPVSAQHARSDSTAQVIRISQAVIPPSTGYRWPGAARDACTLPIAGPREDRQPEITLDSFRLCRSTPARLSGRQAGVDPHRPDRPRANGLLL